MSDDEDAGAAASAAILIAILGSQKDRRPRRFLAFSCSSIMHIMLDMDILFRIIIMLSYYGYYGYDHMSQLLDSTMTIFIPESVLDHTPSFVVYLFGTLKSVCWVALTYCFMGLISEYIRDNINPPQPVIREPIHPSMLGG
ncbi:uncharacterized protein LOC111049549 isoform X2 [Nilaparvata lugens]|uniref:uncharacterized protein LOC111049549 isoform X2 n=1 Tax=Nilaparvata lugens TaxID=108931 RepID=UPI00193CBD2D|nr:uncharacterized protein LOC111049549 isoform X2 [Nilaparvata lugens]